jgi:hypothetical protein
VRYNSIAPLAERLKALRLPFGEEIGRDDFLVALRGARVEVHSGSSTATGKLLSVDKTKRQTAKGDVIESTEFSVISDSGEMRNFELGPGTSVRLADRDLNDEVGPLSQSGQFLALARSSSYDHLCLWNRGARTLRQLRERSAGLEKHVPHHSSGESGVQAASARLGHRR